ncbi:hypothetical protein ACQ4WP_14245 [Janthinobacterium sp. GB4P2]|uniref:hypothetical protein n=1 Tax=Janthinobacterium sp. GB4P2 TaxID=3424189 RepID=UPI003F247ED3
MSSDPLAPPVLRLTFTRDPLASASDCPAAPGWHGQTHVLSSTRGIGSCRIALDIGPADVVQLLLCDGSSLLASSLDLPRYPGPATAARDGAPASIEVGLALHPQAADAFLPVLDEAMRDAEQRGLPLRIVAHGMGGLVARLALKDRWQRFGALPGSRLLQVGTANRGTQAMVQVLLGRDRLVQMLACWIGWKHTRRQFLGFVRAFPGVLDMLPWPQRAASIISMPAPGRNWPPATGKRTCPTRPS